MLTESLLLHKLLCYSGCQTDWISAERRLNIGWISFELWWNIDCILFKDWLNQHLTDTQSLFNVVAGLARAAFKGLEWHGWRGPQSPWPHQHRPSHSSVDRNNFYVLLELWLMIVLTWCSTDWILVECRSSFDSILITYSLNIDSIKISSICDEYSILQYCVWDGKDGD